MTTLNRKILIDAMIKHETLTVDDIGKSANLGVAADKGQLDYFLRQLYKDGMITVLDGVIPCTYTITDKGIKEGERLAHE